MSDTPKEIEKKEKKTKKSGGWSEQKGVSDIGPTKSRQMSDTPKKEKRKKRTKEKK